MDASRAHAPARAAVLLQTADACHDDDPPRAAGLLQSLDFAELDAGQRPRVAFLLTHVFAERLGQPGEAWRLQQALLATCGPEAPLPLLRHAAAAARLAGDGAGEAALTSRLADTAGVPPGQAADLVTLAATVFGLSRLHAAQAGEAALAALAPLHGPAWQSPSALDGPAAALTNNLASELAERPLPELDVPAVRRAMDEGARLAQGFWHRAGQWVQHERAHYLRALVANALGESAMAAEQASAGLVLLANHDTDGQQRVDEAFLRSELAHALSRLGRGADASVERGMADALADAFDDAELVAWYRRRLARQVALDAMAGGAQAPVRP
ncbi:MAG: hypothetical protein HY856_03060 [Burkholderiales bacterium]|nr:hypothetical protein [Burkholderiales bacterium]